MAPAVGGFFMTDSSKGAVSLAGALAIGIGGMVGGGIFAVLGVAVSLAHGATPIAFAFAGAVAMLTAYSYAKLSVAYPSQGGTVVFLDKGFGHDRLTACFNLVLWLSYLVTLSLYATAFASYAQTFFPDSLQSSLLRHVLISVAIIGPVFINLKGAALISKSETVIVLIKLVLLAVVVVAGVKFVQPGNLAVSNWAPASAFIPAGMVIFVAYEGFELIANAAEDVRDPAKTLPRAFYLSVGIVIALYILVAIITVGVVPESVIANSKDYVLAEAAKPALGHFGFSLVGVAAMLATISAINATIYGNARLGYTLAKERELPEVLEEKFWDQPSGVLITGGLSLIMANTLNLQDIAVISSAGFLLIFAMVNLAGLRLADSINARRLPMIIGTAACFISLGMLMQQSFSTNPTACWLFAAVLVGSYVFETIYTRVSGCEPKLNL